MTIQVTGKGSDRNVIADGRHIDEEYAYGYAKQNQGYEGSYAEWLDLPADEREAYELGAAGIST